ncbi:OB-fold domain-containing protein [Streptomyces sp. NPDC048417]|uniref:OB-fold domain-containing protein n=1 Tax=Streptomyces sp. NPDC048417 TaxID=3155387 RepID=UPI0034256098
MSGIVNYHCYIPQYRLRRSEIAAALGADASGERSVAGYDEDTTTLGVAAALPVVQGRAESVGSLWFATSDPVYADKTNATTVHAALDLPPDITAVDLGANLRSGITALLAAARDGGLAVLADRRGGPLGGADERTGGDASAAYLFGDDGTLADLTHTASATAEFIDRWRAPGSSDAHTWEERFGEQRYAELADQLLTTLAKQGLDLDGIDRFAVAGLNPRAVRTVGAAVRRTTGAQQQGADLADAVGNTGTAHAGLLLADLLDAAEPGEHLLLVSLADGADAIVLRAADTITELRGRPVRDQMGDGVTIGYPQYLLWRRRVEGERPRRPEPDRPSAPYAWRNRRYKLSMTGGRCHACGTVQYPMPTVCYRCRHTRGFDPVKAGDESAHIVTYTVDRLAFSPSPPLVSAIVAFESGGRLQCELTDVRDPIEVGDEVVPTFRRGATVDGIHNYVWKSRPHRDPSTDDES